MNELTISNTSVRRDASGRYSLNDLHRAAGGEKRHAPNEWLRLQQTQALATELEREKPGNPGIESKQGVGTFVAKELVYAYAMWISPAFHLQVIRAYDAQVNVPTLPDFTDPAAAAWACPNCAACGSSKRRTASSSNWSRA